MNITQEQIAALVKRLRDGVGMQVGAWPVLIHEAADMLEQLAAERAKPTGVRVRALEWRESGFEQDADLVDTTEAYQIQEGIFWYGSQVNGTPCGDNEAAKAAAQADYEARVLAALDHAPDATTSQTSMLRPIDRLSDRIGCTALTRMKRLRDQADWLEKHGDVNLATITRISDKREYADLIEEIHRLSNPDFPKPALAEKGQTND